MLKGYCEEEGTDYDAIRKTYAAFVFIDKDHAKGVEASKGWEDRAIAGAEKPMLGFETLTFAPIDRHLIALDLLSPDERAWVDAYHAKVLSVVGPQLDGDAKTWLESACAPL